jgi:hypothetical protein
VSIGMGCEACEEERERLVEERDALKAALENLVRDAQAAVDQDNPFLGKQLNDLGWNTIPAARQALDRLEEKSVTPSPKSDE